MAMRSEYERSLTRSSQTSLVTRDHFAVWPLVHAALSGKRRCDQEVQWPISQIFRSLAGVWHLTSTQPEASCRPGISGGSHEYVVRKTKAQPSKRDVGEDVRAL